MAQAPQLNDSQLNLLAKIAANTGETQPKHGDGQHNLLFKIAQNTYASSGLAGSALQPSGDGYVLCQQGDDLAARYAEAKAKSPSVTNRVTLFIVPGTYSLSSELAIDAEFVDIVGLGAQFQSPAVIVTNNTLNVTANDVRVSGVSVGAQEFKISDNKPLQVFENCKGGNGSFAGNGGTASGEFVGCVGGDDSFGGYDIEQSSTASFINCIAGDDGFGGNTGEYPSGKYISCRITSGSFPTIYIPGRARFCLDDDYNIVNADGGYDSDAESYFTTAGVTNATAKDQINLFIIGLKRLGLWDDMACWPLRSAQNAGTGSTAYSLGGLGTYNGTLVNGPTWGSGGVNFNVVNAYIGVTGTFTQPLTVMGAVNFKTTTNGGSLIDGSSRITLFNGEEVAQVTMFAGTTLASGANTYSPGNHFIAGHANGASSVVYLNGAGTTGNAGSNSLGNTQIIIGNNDPLNFGDKNLDIAFCAIFSGQAYNDSVRALYKSTLGQGLSLP
jgi:hypothetical protein